MTGGWDEVFCRLFELLWLEWNHLPWKMLDTSTSRPSTEALVSKMLCLWVEQHADDALLTVHILLIWITLTYAFALHSTRLHSKNNQHHLSRKLPLPTKIPKSLEYTFKLFVWIRVCHMSRKIARESHFSVKLTRSRNYWFDTPCMKSKMTQLVSYRGFSIFVLC